MKRNCESAQGTENAPKRRKIEKIKDRTLAVSSISAHFELGSRIELKTAVGNVQMKPGVGFIRKRFRRAPGTTAIFASGRVKLFGNRTEFDARKNAERLSRYFRRLRYYTMVENFSVYRVCGKARFPEGIDFRACEQNVVLRGSFSHLAEQNFATIKLGSSENEKIVAKCTRKGRALILGSRDEKEMFAAYLTLCSLLDNLQIDNWNGY